ncbi:MAG: DUF2064 domain-containing protein [Pseudomonadota bacterium]
MTRPLVVVFAKVPRPGRVKTRLGRDIGRVGAAWWFRHQLADLTRRLGRDPRWDLVLRVAPDAEGMASRALPAGPRRLPQGGGDLGRRMVRALDTAPPGRPVAVIGADIPGIDGPSLAAAFRALAGAEAVLGPSPDGGFWLIGRAPGARWPAHLLDGARWSTPHARADTLARLAPRRVAEGPRLADVDTLADIGALGLPLPHRAPA